jgi:hypothetical protein
VAEKLAASEWLLIRSTFKVAVCQVHSIPNFYAPASLSTNGYLSIMSVNVPSINRHHLVSKRIWQGNAARSQSASPANSTLVNVAVPPVKTGEKPTSRIDAEHYWVTRGLLAEARLVEREHFMKQEQVLCPQNCLFNVLQCSLTYLAIQALVANTQNELREQLFLLKKLIVR